MTSYISTRGPGDPKSFTDVMLGGMAEDGGLYIPEKWPLIKKSMFDQISGTSYSTVAEKVISPFVGNSIPKKDFTALVEQTYCRENFDHAAIAPLIQIGPNAWILELFHGPTYSFKDYALQLLGRLFDYVLEQRGEHLTIVGATSGDTGSAAIEACRYCKNIDIFILHPEGRTSEMQRKQMTTVDAPNVHNIALQGTFDDCQALVKGMFADKALRNELNLSAVNSINWARIMAQTVYYISTAMALGAGKREIAFAVPTGNFGNVYAGWVAKQMGAPVHSLTIATNRNDIITRFFENGEMKVGQVNPSISPSMDIQVSSNFERFLCDLVGRDHETVRGMMDDFAKKKNFAVSKPLLKKAQKEFQAFRCDDEDTLATIGECYKETGIFIDPHTAVALNGAMQARIDPDVPTVVLACAHPAKFADAVKEATGKEPPIPDGLAALAGKAEFVTPLGNDLDRLKTFVRDQMKERKAA